jgi:hypothetical protein
MLALKTVMLANFIAYLQIFPIFSIPVYVLLTNLLAVCSVLDLNNPLFVNNLVFQT